MRSMTGQDIAVLSAPDGYSVRARVWVWDGAAWQNVTTLEGRDWLVEVAWDESINDACAQATVQLRRRLEDLSLNPLVSNKLTGVLALGRAFYVEAATLPLGDAPISGDWREVFRGTIEALALDKDPITFTGRDDAGKLMRTYIETAREYGSVGGVAIETVMQSILTDNSTGVTLYTPTSPGAVLGRYKQKKTPTLTACRERALSIGWDLRMYWDSGTGAFRFTLLQPQRTASVSLWTFQPRQVRQVTRLAQTLDDIRNAGALFYYNRSALDAGGKPTLASVTSSDATSISTYGRQWMQLSEDENSPIDSPTEAQTMLDSAIADLKDPLLDFGVEVGFHYGVQLGDLLAFAADDLNFSSTQTLAVVSAAHRIGVKGHSSALTLRGKPAGAHDDWLRRDGRVRQQPPASQPDAVGGMTVTSTASGAVVAFTAPTVPPIPVEYELHKSTTSGFTPSTSTLHERASRTNFNLTGLSPGVTYYLRVVPRDDVGNRGAPSAETSVTPRYVAPLDAQPLVAWGSLPPNSDFEANTISGSPPDTWVMDTGTWGTGVVTTTDCYSGSTALKLLSGQSAPVTVASQLMSVRPSQRYVASIISRSAGTATTPAEIALQCFATHGGSVLSSTSLVIGPTNGVWTPFNLVAITPSTARYARVRILLGASSPVDLYVDSVDFAPGSIPQEPWKLVGITAGETYDVPYENGWTTFGSGFGQVGFRVNSLGNLELKGMCKSRSTALGAYAVIFTLPTGYRPATEALLRKYITGTGDFDLNINTNGTVTLSSYPTSTYFSFDGMWFPLS